MSGGRQEVKITLDLPAPIADDLAAQSRDSQLDVALYAAELLAQAVENRKLDDAALLHERPDWQLYPLERDSRWSGLRRFIAAGQVVLYLPRRTRQVLRPTGPPPASYLVPLAVPPTLPSPLTAFSAPICPPLNHLPEPWFVSQHSCGITGVQPALLWSPGR